MRTPRATASRSLRPALYALLGGEDSPRSDMKLPNAERLVIDGRKVREYLLSRSHPIGRFKTAFFARAGFHAGNWVELTSALRQLARQGEAISDHADQYGQRYLVSGTLRGPTGVELEVTTVWILSGPDAPPRLVTVFPR